MRVALIRPRMGSAPSPDAMEPLAFAPLLASSPEGVEYRLYDEMVEELPRTIEADLAALTVQTFSAARAYELARSFRDRDIPVVLGGPHPTLLPEEAGLHGDAVVRGSGESVWSLLLSHAGRGELRPLYEGGEGFHGADYDRSLFSKKKYLPLHSVEFHRGCRYGCDFCSVPVINGPRPKGRSPAQVAEEISRLSARRILLVDDNLLAAESEFREFLRLVEPLRIQWGCQISLDVAFRGDLLERMARSGCVIALVGFESMDPRNLERMEKRANPSPHAYARAVKRFHDNNILLYGSFLFGYDHDTPETLERALEFSLENRLFLANFNTLTPMPGTPLYDRLRREGRLLQERWWLDPRFSYGEVAFRPRSMTPEELKQGCLEIRRKFFRLSSLGRRLPPFTWNRSGLLRLGLYLASNLVAGRSLARKMGQLEGV